MFLSQEVYLGIEQFLKQPQAALSRLLYQVVVALRGTGRVTTTWQREISKGGPALHWVNSMSQRVMEINKSHS